MRIEAYHEMKQCGEQHWWYAGLDQLVVELTRQCLEGKSEREILDAGCGSGRLCRQLTSHGNVSGCDIHHVALEMTSAAGFAAFRCDLSCDNLGEARYNLITCLDVLYHQWITDEQRVLEGFWKALRPGGFLILQVPAFEVLRGSHDEVVMGQRRYRREGVARLLEQNGFQVQQISYRLLALFPLVWCRRNLTRVLPWRQGGGSDLGEVPGMLNRVLKAYVTCENRYLLAGKSLPFGTSLIAVARKPL